MKKSYATRGGGGEGGMKLDAAKTRAKGKA
jgi:hypothetical protein